MVYSFVVDLRRECDYFILLFVKVLIKGKQLRGSRGHFRLLTYV